MGNMDKDEVAWHFCRDGVRVVIFMALAVLLNGLRIVSQHGPESS